MPKLAEHISVRGRFARSANLERDAESSEMLNGYVVTYPALDVLRRIAGTAVNTNAGGAWSLTGPYGSGKSSFALLVAAAFGQDSPMRRAAMDMISEVSTETYNLINAAHRKNGTEAPGFNIGAVTADHNSVTRTVLRALHTAVLRRYNNKIPNAKTFAASPLLRRVLKDAKSTAGTTFNSTLFGTSPSSLVEIACCLAKDAPLILIIDEFGKTLEAFEALGDTDFYLLQRIAEAGQGAGVPIFLLTLQHLSFEDYTSQASVVQRREWAKVRGRFEDVPFVGSAGQTRSIIGTAFEVRNNAAALRLQAEIERWAEQQARTVQQLGLVDIANAQVIGNCYPLHPLVTLLLPELCNRYSQRERTVFTFLTSLHESGVRSFLKRTADPGTDGISTDHPGTYDPGTNHSIKDHSKECVEALPTVGLDAVYDYFVGSGLLLFKSERTASRWVEIVTKLRDIHGLTSEATRLVKAIAVLNLVSTSGAIRASKAILSLTAPSENADQKVLNAGQEAISTAQNALKIDDILAELESKSVIVYRAFADEYRIWQGTDLDVNNLIDKQKSAIAKRPLAQILNNIYPTQPVIAARHSAKHDTVRVFRKRYIGLQDEIEGLSVSSQYDGELLVLVSSCSDKLGREHNRSGVPFNSEMRFALEKLCGQLKVQPKATGRFAKPIVVAIPFLSKLKQVDTSARELAAVQSALNTPYVKDDYVAEGELRERLASVQSVLDRAISDAFEPASCGWMLLSSDGYTGYTGHNNRDKNAQWVMLQGGRGSAALSEAADKLYEYTPRVGNEMLNRVELTAQGVAARRKLFGAMVEHSSKADLGMEGHRPEVSMYRAFLQRSGIHGQVSSDQQESSHKQGLAFRQPKNDINLSAAWGALQEEFKRSISSPVNLRDVYTVLSSPPFGMKAGAIPVLVVAALIASADEVAVYEHGTFKPVLTTDVVDRMVCNPVHFDIRHFANTTGARFHVVEALARRFQLLPQAQSSQQFLRTGNSRTNKHRVSNVLTVVGYLVREINRLNNYVLHTEHIKPETLKMREAIKHAVEPDELIFSALPQALGCAPVDTNNQQYQHTSAYVEKVWRCLDELSLCFNKMLLRQYDLIINTSGAVTRQNLAAQAASIAERVSDLDARAFTLALNSAMPGLSGEDFKLHWTKVVVTVVAGKAPSEWTDKDITSFQERLSHKFLAFHRLVALHTDIAGGLHNDGLISADDTAGLSKDGADDLSNTYRVIVTRGDGVEQARLVTVNQDIKSEVENEIDRIVKDVTRVTKSSLAANHALLALISEKLVDTATDSPSSVARDAS